MRSFNARLIFSSVIFVWIGLTSCRLQPSAKPKLNVRVISQTLAPWINALLTIYGRDFPDAAFSWVQPSDSLNAVDYLENGSADISFAQADVVYLAFTKGTETERHPHRNLRGMAVLHPAALHVIAADGLNFHSFRDLRGKRIALGPPGNSTDVMMPLFLAQFGINLSDIRLEHASFEEAAAEFNKAALDAELVFSAVPGEIPHAGLSAAGTHLVSIPETEISILRNKYSFLRPVTIPTGTYGQSAEIQTLGVDFLFVCRAGLDEDLVYRLLSKFFDSIPELSQLRPPLRNIRFDQAPSTPIPLHPGATRFYREHQLFN